MYVMMVRRIQSISSQHLCNLFIDYVTESNSTVTAAADTTTWLVIVILECFVTCTAFNS